MSHYTPEQWADFARRNLASEDELKMEQHLESGCAACVQTLKIWLGVLEVATGLNLYTPPDDGVHFIKALYRALPLQKSAEGRVDVVHLLLPAFARGAEGVRSPGAKHRHFVFQRENVLLDVQIELRPDTGKTSMAGQILDPVTPSGRFAARSALLLSEEEELAKATTNEFGEFQLEFAAASDLMLVIHLDPEALLVTPIPAFVLAASAPGSGLEMLTEDNDDTE